MNKLKGYNILFLLSFVLLACGSRNAKSGIVGKWNLVSIESKINGELSAEPILPALGDVFYEFHKDSMYVLCELDSMETGRWVLLNDSLLGILHSGCRDDSANYIWMRIKSIDDSIMVMCNTQNTDYGIVDETCFYRRGDF